METVSHSDVEQIILWVWMEVSLEQAPTWQKLGILYLSVAKGVTML